MIMRVNKERKKAKKVNGNFSAAILIQRLTFYYINVIIYYQHSSQISASLQ